MPHHSLRLSVAPRIDLFPGFPLPRNDYQPLLLALNDLMPALPRLKLAHSLGVFEALADPVDAPAVLLAPSTPGSRRGRTVTRLALQLGSRTPLSTKLAQQLRRLSYQRFREVAPAGDPLSLADAAARLSIPTTMPLPAPGAIHVLCAAGDERHLVQVAFARALGAELHWVRGGHLFPIAEPMSTARSIMTALSMGPSGRDYRG